MLALPDELTRFVTASLLNNSARYSQNAFTFHDFLQYYVYYPRHVLCCLVRHLGFHGRKQGGLEPIPKLLCEPSFCNFATYQITFQREPELFWRSFTPFLSYFNWSERTWCRSKKQMADPVLSHASGSFCARSVLSFVSSFFCV